MHLFLFANNLNISTICSKTSQRITLEHLEDVKIRCYSVSLFHAIISRHNFESSFSIIFITILTGVRSSICPNFPNFPYSYLLMDTSFQYHNNTLHILLFFCLPIDSINTPVKQKFSQMTDICSDTNGMSGEWLHHHYTPFSHRF